MNLRNKALTIVFAGLIAGPMLQPVPQALAVEYHHGSDAVEKKLSVKEFSPYCISGVNFGGKSAGSMSLRLANGYPDAIGHHYNIHNKT